MALRDITHEVSRLLPVLPFGFLSYAWGLANVPARSYAIATLLGMTPPTLLLNYLGEDVTALASGTLVQSKKISLASIGTNPLFQWMLKVEYVCFLKFPKRNPNRNWYQSSMPLAQHPQR